MSKKIFTNARIFTGERLLPGRELVIEGKRIAGFTQSSRDSGEVIDCKGGILAPGLIDLQIYGGGGYLFSAALTSVALHAVADDLVKKGTTTFFITLATNSFDVFKKAIRTVRDHPHPAIAGIHLEGPYLNPVKKGAHIEKYIKKPDLPELERLLDEAGGLVKMMTIAPEQCSREAIELLLQHDVLLSAGHSNATFDEAMDGFDAGIGAATHLFNAMSPLHHRTPGLPGAVFLHDHVYASIIPDGIHVDFEIGKIAKRLLGERLFYITDAVEEVGEGPYIHVRKNDRFTLPDGTLSGSALTMPLCVKNGVQRMDIPLGESLRMASLYPARLAGFQDVGKMEPGCMANLVCLSPELDLRFTVLQGEVISAT